MSFNFSLGEQCCFAVSFLHAALSTRANFIHESENAAGNDSRESKQKPQTLSPLKAIWTTLLPPGQQLRPGAARRMQDK